MAAACACLIGCPATPEAPAPAPAPTPTVAVEPAPAPTPDAVEPAPAIVSVSVWQHAQGARAVFELPAPARQVQLRRSDAVRRDTWRSVTPGVELVDGLVTSAEPLTRFELTLAPDPVEIDRIYPSLHRVGRGVALYGPALLVEGVETHVVLRPDAGSVAIPEHAAEAGYAYLGPAEEVTQADGLRIVAGDDITPALLATIRREAEVSLRYYRDQLERPGREPTILVATSPGPFEYRGDASQSAVISLRFMAAHMHEADVTAPQFVAKFVRHEAFHLWNAPTTEGVPDWLHEGGAEYAAIVSAVANGALTQEEGVAQLSRNLGRCSEALGERSLVTAELSGWQIYACGVTLQWVADVEARGGSQGRRDTFAIWRDLLRAGDAGGYTLADLRAATGPTTALLLDAAGPRRWPDLARAVAGHGAKISDGADAVLEAPALAPSR
ncbi:hypothetical protein [Nannocystis bainbridge]|uniref:Peptidase M61 catalytic domain-containing protein n=1 Tax=Nannocystis bainbridge TaxID=2995303 RepID=A0ABT5EC20_9BACT|nr:hypothetical protein [Nannocystis bainbridge]MDC0723419.1 hypothetical protein [Nannocystis bainbridge]